MLSREEPQSVRFPAMRTLICGLAGLLAFSIFAADPKPKAKAKAQIGRAHV